MWCRKCLREFQVNGGAKASAACPLCGQFLEETTRQSQAIRQAREILERWQASSLFDRIQETESVAPLKQQADVAFPGLPGARAAERSVPAVLPHHPVAEKTPLEAAGRGQQAALQKQPAAAISSHRSLVRELPPLPTDLLAPPPLMAAAARSDSHLRKAARPAAAGTLIPAVARPVEPEPELAVAAAELAAPVAERTLPSEEPVVSESAGGTSEPPSAEFSPAAPHAQEHVDELAAYFETAGSDLMDTAADALASQPARNAADESGPPVILPADVRVVDVSPPCTAAVAEEPEMSSENPAEARQFVLPMAGLPSAEAQPSETAAVRSRPVQRRPPLSRRPQVSHSAHAPNSGDSDMSQSQPADAKAAVAAAGSVAAGSPENSPGPRLRFDSGASLQQLAAADHGRVRTESPSAVRSIDQVYAGTPRSLTTDQQNARRTNVTSLIGQTLSYLGVLGLTVGTSMVILGHFGGYSDYTPTGWLVTTVAQMLLFLGVINLVSGGIEQNNEDVSRRISALGEQLLRIEQSTATLRGPHVPSAAWLQDQADTRASETENAATVPQQRSHAV
jgi:hypothetical protein